MRFVVLICFGLFSKLFSQNLTIKEIVNYQYLRFDKYSHLFSKPENIYTYKNNLIVFENFKCYIFDINKFEKVIDLKKKKYLGEDVKFISSKHETIYYFSNDTLVVKSDTNYFAFKWLNSDFSYIKRMSLKYKGPELYFLNGNIYTYGIYNYTNNQLNIKSGYCKLNLFSNNIKKKDIKFEYLPLTHFAPNKFMDFNSNGDYFIVDPLKYQLKLFTNDDLLIDSIDVPYAEFNQSVETIRFLKDSIDEQVMAKYPTSYFQKVGSIIDKSDRIWQANFIGNKSIVIRISRKGVNSNNAGGPTFYDHLWRNDKGKWRLVQVKKLKIDNFDSQVSLEEMWPYFLVGTKVLFRENNLLYLTWTSEKSNTISNYSKFFGFDVSDKEKLHLRIIKFN
jgi:hypothetical protein